MPRKPRERVAETNVESRTKNNQAAEKITKDNADAVTESGNPSTAAVQELTRAYQELMTKNVRKLTDSMQALAAVKSPTEFMQLQQRLIREGVEAAVSDGQHIAQLTNAVFIAAFEPIKKRFESARENEKT
jgi:phasin family protein